MTSEKINVYLADVVADECEAILTKAGFTVDNRPGLPADEAMKAIAAADAVVVRSSTTITDEMMGKAPKLKVIGRAGSGVDNIDVKAATSRGILVMNAPGENTTSAAEHALAMMMALSRNIPAADAKLRSGGWGKKGLMGVELNGKTLAVIGLGRIGREMATRAKAFNMRILGYDPFLPPEVAHSMGFEMGEVDDILPQADFISLHAPLTKRTRHILDSNAFLKCKPGVRIINCARGGLMDDEALVVALDSGHVAGAALDVFELEPLPKDHPLRTHPKVVLTPHLGASTDEAQENVAVRIAEQFDAFLNRGEVRNAVNSFSVDAAVAGRLEPFLQLAKSMGDTQARLLEGHFQSMDIEIAGEMANDFPAEPLVAATLTGFLGRLLSQNVNPVNAQAVAKEHGYGIKHTTTQGTGPYVNLLSLQVKSTAGERLISGTVFGKGNVKVVRMDGAHIEFSLTGYLLLCRNDDKPGRLAGITSALAGNKVNIADCALGRDSDTGCAITALHLDTNLNESALQAVADTEGVQWCKFVNFND
jgi:D-3-phosphoglycerate dehydrogenase